MPARIDLRRQPAQHFGSGRRGLRLDGERPLDWVQPLAAGAKRPRKEQREASAARLHCDPPSRPDALDSSLSMRRFRLAPANSAATRIAFLIALALERPWQMMLTPLTPSNGAP